MSVCVSVSECVCVCGLVDTSEAVGDRLCVCMCGLGTMIKSK